MDDPIAVRILGTQVARAAGVTGAWREEANWARERLTARFGEQVKVEYYDLFSQEMERFPQVLALVRSGDGSMPLVFVGTDQRDDRREKVREDVIHIEASGRNVIVRRLFEAPRAIEGVIREVDLLEHRVILAMERPEQ